VLGRALNRSLQPVATGLALLFTGIAIHHLLLPPGEIPMRLVLLVLLSALFFFMARLATGRWAVPQRLVGPLALAMAAVGLNTVLAHIIFLHDPRQTIQLMLFLLGAGGFFVTARSLLTVMVSALPLWFWLGPAQAGDFDADSWPGVPALPQAWAPYGVGLLLATIGSVLVFRQRTRRLLGDEGRHRPAPRLNSEQTEPQACDRQDQFHQWCEVSAEGLALHDRGVILESNAALAEMLGYAPADLAGRHISELIAPESREAASTSLRLGSLKPVPAAGLRRDGTTLPVELFTKTLSLRGRPLTATAFRDLSERRQMEEAMAEEKRRLAQQHRFQSTLADIDLAIHKPQELRVLLQRIAAIVRDTLPARAGACLILRDQFSELLQIEAAVGVATSPQEIFTKLTTGPNATRWVLENKESLVVAHLANDPFTAAHQFERHGIAGYAAFPLLDEGTALGVLVALDTEPGGYDRAALSFLDGLAHRAAAAIIKVRLYEQMLRTNQRLECQRAELQLTNNELASAKELAEQASRAKSEFLDTVSHELRTPLNGVLGMTSLLRDTGLTDEQRDYLDTAHTSAEKLLKIVNELLDFARIESGKLKFEHGKFELRRVIHDLVDSSAALARGKGLDLEAWIAPDVPAAFHGDAARLSQLVNILVDNAIKFTEQGKINIRITRLNDHGQETELRFEVSDTGIGIAPAIRPRLFLAFSQADGSTTRKHGGIGLGLAIARQIVERMHGQIGVQSVPGMGSTFWFTLRLPVAAPVGALDNASTEPVPA
jgi:PAS domain S-box-containing protein